MTEKNLRAADICAKLGISPSCLYKWIAKGIFPKGTRYGEKLVAWSNEDLEKWIADKRDGAPVKPSWTK